MNWNWDALNYWNCFNTQISMSIPTKLKYLESIFSVFSWHNFPQSQPSRPKVIDFTHLTLHPRILCPHNPHQNDKCFVPSTLPARFQVSTFMNGRRAVIEIYELVSLFKRIGFEINMLHDAKSFTASSDTCTWQLLVFRFLPCDCESMSRNVKFICFSSIKIFRC